MRFAVVASALFAGLVAAAPAVTQTVHATEVQTITSCGPEVTNCPARSASTMAVVPTSSVVAPIAAQNVSSVAMPSTVTLYSTKAVTITSCAASVTDCPARVSSTVISVGTTVVTGAVQVPTSAPFGMTNSTMATGPQGTAASTGFGASATATKPATYTGAASQLSAGMALAGVAGFAALLI
ncbi:hypothetical protein E4T44_06248 [Aureobasidium sp. EXF-8845]|jgi:hypothetical protein|nr:hypothetical protein E4T45_11987 [Aureobasidium sp. EXF-8846]KAI4844330.1 hypothetical protein E4T44_06248 [Aureobasidium sp. EXF-8845]